MRSEKEVALGYIRRESFCEDIIIREEEEQSTNLLFESVGICVLIEKDVSLLLFYFIFCFRF